MTDVAECWIVSVRNHHHVHGIADGIEWDDVFGHDFPTRSLDARQDEVRIPSGSTKTREVSRTGKYLLLRELVDNDRGEPRHFSRTRSKGTLPHDSVLYAQIQYRRQVGVESTGLEFARDQPGTGTNG